jgi:hypothetical protein
MRLSRSFLFFLLLLYLSIPVHGQGGNKKRIEEKAKFLPIPYLNYDRSMGFMVGAVPLVMFNPSEKDTLSPSSLVGGLGMYSTNKTWFGMGFGMFYLNEDRWRITTAGGVGTVHFQFFVDFLSGVWVPYETDADFFMVRVERKIWHEFYGGISFVHADIINRFGSLPVNDTLALNGLGLHLSWDRRDNPHYPRSGYHSEIGYSTFPGFLGNEKISQKIQLEHNHYFSVRRNTDVVASRIFMGFAPGDPGFSQQYVVSGKDIRGYTQGAFRGDYLLALQGEYRWNFHRRWGAVGFAGLATVFRAINDSDNGKLLPGAGAGIRFRAFPENNFSVGIDVAAGIDDWGIYFQIGEAF